MLSTLDTPVVEISEAERKEIEDLCSDDKYKQFGKRKIEADVFDEKSLPEQMKKVLHEYADVFLAT